MPATPDVVTFITFGVLSIIACLLALILPETGDEDLPDTGKLFQEAVKNGSLKYSLFNCIEKSNQTLECIRD